MSTTVPSGHHIDVDGARLFVRWWRMPQADKPALVFLHDGLGSTETLRRFPDQLAEACALPAFGYDRWGYGRSDARPTLPVPFMEDCADRLPRVLRAAGIADYIVVGHSDGGTIALLHAMTNPPGLRATVSIAAHVHDDDASHFQLDRHAALAASGELPDWLVRFQGDRTRATRLAAEWTRVWKEAFTSGWDLTERLCTIGGPLLALHGSRDDYGEAGQLNTIRAAVPQADCVLLPGLGHFPHLDAPEAVVAHVAAFVHRYAG